MLKLDVNKKLDNKYIPEEYYMSPTKIYIKKTEKEKMGDGTI